MQKENIRPKQLLKDIGREFPTAWKDVKMFREDKAKGLTDWADWCYLPIAAGLAIASNGDDFLVPQAILDTTFNAATITAAATWRVSQGIYRFDADLYNSLIEQPLDDNLPCEALKKLPEYCVYIETAKNAQIIGKPIDGFFAHLEEDANDKRMELRFVFLCKNGENFPFPIHLGDWTLEEGVKRMGVESNKHSKERYNMEFPFSYSKCSKEITPFLQLVLYLCAENIDVPGKPVHPSTRQRMSGGIDAPKEPRVWTVGARIGSAIRKHRNQEIQQQGREQELSSTHASPRPHIRRAHWHHFWTGPRDSEQKLIVRWLSPIPVGDNDDGGPVVVHPVK